MLRPCAADVEARFVNEMRDISSEVGCENAAMSSIVETGEKHAKGSRARFNIEI